MILGFVVGSITALWMAPRSGNEARQGIKNRAQSSVRIISDRVQGESVEDSIELGKAIAHQKKADSANTSKADYVDG
jgi:gas vesicle protein